MMRALLTAAVAAAALVALVPADGCRAPRLRRRGAERPAPGPVGEPHFPADRARPAGALRRPHAETGRGRARPTSSASSSRRGSAPTGASCGPCGRAPGVTIRRDRWDVPHVTGRTRSDVMFGAGWATAEDRGLLMNLLRGPGRVAALDVPGLDAFALANSATAFTPSPETEARLTAQIALLRAQGAARAPRHAPTSTRTSRGSTPSTRSAGYGITAWTRNDVVAVAALIGVGLRRRRRRREPQRPLPRRPPRPARRHRRRCGLERPARRAERRRARLRRRGGSPTARLRPADPTSCSTTAASSRCVPGAARRRRAGRCRTRCWSAAPARRPAGRCSSPGRRSATRTRRS